MIGLCSKKYIVRKTTLIKPSSTRLAALRILNKTTKRGSRRVQSRRVHKYKFSSKWVRKRHLQTPMAKFRIVLKTHKAKGGRNRGFRVRNNTVCTYMQERRGLSYLFSKRKVLNDGIHTVPLEITLSPPFSVKRRSQ